MYSPVHEPIAVLAEFNGSKIKPLSFKWQKHTYNNLRLSLAYKTRQGQDLLTYFCVDDGVNYFKLVFNSQTLEWHLEEINS